MASWTAIDVNSRLPGEPWTSAKVNAVYENPTAIAEGSSGAPRIADATFVGNRSSTDTNTLNVAGEYGGLWINFAAYAGSGGSDTAQLRIDFSDDGSTWSSKLDLTGALTTDQYKIGLAFVEYVSGNYKLFINGGDAVTYLGATTGTIGSWPTGIITHVRLNTTITLTGKTTFIGRHQGGEAVL